MNEIYAKVYELCTSANISISQLCRDVNISRSVLSELKAGRSKNLSIRNIALVSDYFGVPKEFLLGVGVFANWREIIDHIDPVFGELRYLIPRTFTWHESDPDFLFAYLDSAFYYGNNLPLFLNWLFEAVEKIRIIENELGLFDEGIPPVEVEIVFRDRFKILIDDHREQEDHNIRETREKAMYKDIDDLDLPRTPQVLPGINFLRLIGRDGKHIEKKLTDEQMQMLRVLISQLPEAPDDI